MTRCDHGVPVQTNLKSGTLSAIWARTYLAEILSAQRCLVFNTLAKLVHTFCELIQESLSSLTSLGVPKTQDTEPVSVSPSILATGTGFNLAGISANHFVSIVSLLCLYLLRESGELNQLRTNLVIL
jgi:hypothetical protein